MLTLYVLNSQQIVQLYHVSSGCVTYNLGKKVCSICVRLYCTKLSLGLQVH